MHGHDVCVGGCRAFYILRNCVGVSTNACLMLRYIVFQLRRVCCCKYTPPTEAQVVVLHYSMYILYILYNVLCVLCVSFFFLAEGLISRLILIRCLPEVLFRFWHGITLCVPVHHDDPVLYNTRSRAAHGLFVCSFSSMPGKTIC